MTGPAHYRKTSVPFMLCLFLCLLALLVPVAPTTALGNPEGQDLESELTDSIDLLATVSIKASKAKSYFESKVGQGYKSNACLAFVRQMWQGLGAGYSSACCAYKYGSSYSKYSSQGNIPIGADVFFSGSNVTCSGCGSHAGHVGVYVGDGYIVHVWSGKVRKDTITYVVNCGYGFRGWGYHGGVSIQDDLSHTHSYGNFTYAPSPSGGHVKTGTCSCGAKSTVNEGCSFKWVSGERYACAYCGASFNGSKPFGTVTSVPNGTYVISSAGNSNLCLDVMNGSSDNGIRLQLYPKNNSNAQNFRLTRNSDGTYTIANVGSGKVVEIGGSNIFNGGVIQQWADGGIATQRRYLEKNSDGTFSFRNANSNMYLDVINGIFSQNTLLHSYPRNGAYAQSFYLEGAGNALGISGSNLRMTGVSSSYDYTGTAVTPKPSLERLVYSSYAITVPESGAGSEYTAYSHVRTISVKAGRTYAVEVGSTQNLSSNPTTPTLRVYDFAADTTVSEWVSFSISGSSQRMTITPTSDGILLFYANYPGSGAYCAARYNSVRVYEVLKEGTDYSVAYSNNVLPGTATLSVSGKNGYSGSASTSFSIVVPSSSTAFSDVDSGAWYASEGYVDYVVSNALISGYKDASGRPTGLFGPQDTVSRGQLATIIYRHANPGSSATTDPAHYATSSGIFIDLPTVAYYNAAVEWCYREGIITGYCDEAGNQTGRFGPNDPVTREQMAAIVYRVAKREGVNTSTSSPAGFESAPDRSQVGSYAVSAMAWCYGRGIITGDATTGWLNPTRPTTRAEASKIITILVRDVK